MVEYKVHYLWTLYALFCLSLFRNKKSEVGSSELELDFYGHCALNRLLPYSKVQTDSIEYKVLDD